MADRKKSQPTHNPNEWKELYNVAVLETDWLKMEERIQAAESAMKGRLHEFSLDHGCTPAENQDIVDALNKLNALRAEVASWQKSKRAIATVATD
jgi:hypothetical protein